MSVRVFVTGVGIVSSLGNSAESTFTRLVAGERGLSHVDLFDTTGQRATLGAVVRGVNVPAEPGWSRSTAFAFEAAKEALGMAGVDPRRARVGLIVGGTTAGMLENEVRVSEMSAKARPREPFEALRSHPLSSTADILHRELGPFARLRSVASACSSGATAMVFALDWLLEDPTLDAVLAGGTDGLCRLTLSGFNALGAIDPEPCKPFDRNRRGLNLGEGAGFLLLERQDAVARRQVTPLAELAGAALGSEGHHITNPEPGGANAARVIAAALTRAGLGAADLDYVNAHGTATPLNDSTESQALMTVLGDQLSRVPVSSSKGQIGHTLGAAGAIEAAITAMVVQRRILPPTIGLVDPDPACPLSHVRQARSVARVRAALSNSFGFGGTDSAVVMTEPELSRPIWPAARKVVLTGAALVTARGIESGAELDSLFSAADTRGLIPDAALTLDPGKARRFDRSARLCVVAARAAMASAEVEGKALDLRSAGIVFGSAFGAVDESAAFVHRLFEKGPRLASPFEFPNLVPSSPIGNASIYLGLHGPSLATADLRSSGECAILSAIELVALGEAEAMIAGGITVRSELVDALFFPLFDDHASTGVRSEIAVAVVVETADTARDRGARIFARVEGRWSLPEGQVPDLEAPSTGAVVVAAVAARSVAARLAGSPWAAVPVWDISRGTGDNRAPPWLPVRTAGHAVPTRGTLRRRSGAA